MLNQLTLCLVGDGPCSSLGRGGNHQPEKNLNRINFRYQQPTELSSISDSVEIVTVQKYSVPKRFIVF